MTTLKLVNKSYDFLKCDDESCNKKIEIGEEYYLESISDPEGVCEFVWCLKHGPTDIFQKELAK